MKAAVVFLVISLFAPWWQLNTTSSEPYGWFQPGPPVGTWMFFPAFSLLSLSEFGTRISLHFLYLTSLLIVSIVLTAVSLFFINRRPKWAYRSAWAACTFCGMGVFLFAILFPRVGYVGDIYWPSGSREFSFGGVTTSFSWVVMPGLFVALVSLVLQTFSALRLTTEALPHEAEPRPESALLPARRTSMRRSAANVALLLIAFSLVSASVWVGLSYSPSLSARAFANDWDYEFKSFRPGEIVTISDLVQNSSLIGSSYGDFTLVQMGDGSSGPVQVMLPGDQRSRYQAGTRASILVHIRTYYYNDISFVWADEAVSPWPFVLSIEETFASVSHVAGLPLFPDAADPSGTTLVAYLVHGLPLEAFKVALMQGTLPYYSESNFVRTEPPANLSDEMTRLHEGQSENGMFTFADVNGNGLLDWGDRFKLNLTPTADAFHIDSYVLGLYGPLFGIAYVAVGNRGPILFHILESETLSTTTYFFDMPPDRVNVSGCSSEVIIAARLGKALPPSSYTVRLYHGRFGTYAEFPAESTLSSLESGVTAKFNDAGEVGIMDEGDSWKFENLTKFMDYSVLLTEERSGSIVATFDWACGVGFNLARTPKVTFSPPVPDASGPAAFFLNVSSVDWMPAGSLPGYRVILNKDGAPLLPSSGTPISIARFPDDPYADALPTGPSSDGAGTWLSFADVDGNLHLGARDSFYVNNTTPGSRYELLLFHYATSSPITNVTWST